MDAPPVAYVRTTDGYDIAYSVSGEGLPLIFVPGQFSHLRDYWYATGMHGTWAQGLAARFRQLRFDGRGQGMSTRDLGEGQTIESLGRDLEAVADHFGSERFVLLARWFGCHMAIRYAAAHPERVLALILIACAEDNGAWPSSVYGVLPDQNWEAFLRSQIPHDSTSDQLREAVSRNQNATSREDLAVRARAFFSSTVAGLLPTLRLPTLVLHPSGYVLLPPSESMRVAAKIPGAKFAFIEGEMVPGDAVTGIRAIEEFLSELPAHPRSSTRTAPPLAKLTPREAEVLHLIAAGMSNQRIADELVLSVRTVERHITNLYAKINAHSKAEATAYSLRHRID